MEPVEREGNGGEREGLGRTACLRKVAEAPGRWAQDPTLMKLHGTSSFWENLGMLPRGRLSQRGGRNQSKVNT